MAYLKLGWSVIPLRRKDKRPAVPWEEFQKSLPDTSLVDEWFERWPEANLGIVTGTISRLVVLDIDPEHGGSDSIERLERRHGRLERTVESSTGGGGRHLYFAHPGGIVRNRVALAQGIDVRGDGGYVVAPPSIHPNGRHYAWRPKRGPDTLKPAPLTPWLLGLLADKQRQTARPPHYWRSLVQEGVGEGERNNSIASLTGHLLWHGVDPDVALELMLSWNRVRCRPPLSDEEVVRTVQSITSLHDRDDGDPLPSG